jgi:predicted metal-dependent enzyme (double-stranded beta helix superfamily)
MTGGIERLRRFVTSATGIVGRRADEATTLAALRPELAALVRHDDWLPERFAVPHPQHYQQYLLHCDAAERFCVVSFVWGPGQRTPVHDHTVWGLIGMLRGSELARRYARVADGSLTPEPPLRLEPGDVDAVSPSIGDIHTVENAFADRVSISIHVYGANIGAVRRHVFDPATGADKPFVSGYASDLLPNLWDRSAAMRADLQRAAAASR